MAIRSGFFNSVNGDRKYKAENMAEYWGSLVGNGVHPEPETGLKVVSNDDMTVTVKPGKAWINGYFMKNDDNYTLDIDVASGILNRTDRVVVRLDKSDREIRLEIKKGEEGSETDALELQRDADAYELGIAEISVRAGAISILQSDVKDTRKDRALCGLVDSVIAGDVVNLSKNLTSHTQRKATSAGLGHVTLSDVVQPSRKINTGTGLLGGGDLLGDRNLRVDFGTGSTQVARGNHGHSEYAEYFLDLKYEPGDDIILIDELSESFKLGFPSRYDLICSYKINARGVFRVSTKTYERNAEADEGTVCGYMYVCVNGVRKGIKRNLISGSTKEYVEDIAVDKGDVIGIYGERDSSISYNRPYLVGFVISYKGIGGDFKYVE